MMTTKLNQVQEAVAATKKSSGTIINRVVSSDEEEDIGDNKSLGSSSTPRVTNADSSPIEENENENEHSVPQELDTIHSSYVERGFSNRFGSHSLRSLKVEENTSEIEDSPTASMSSNKSESNRSDVVENPSVQQQQQQHAPNGTTVSGGAKLPPPPPMRTKRHPNQRHSDEIPHIVQSSSYGASVWQYPPAPPHVIGDGARAGAGYYNNNNHAAMYYGTTNFPFHPSQQQHHHHHPRTPPAGAPRTLASGMPPLPGPNNGVGANGGMAASTSAAAASTPRRRSYSHDRQGTASAISTPESPIPPPYSVAPPPGTGAYYTHPHHPPVGMGMHGSAYRSAVPFPQAPQHQLSPQKQQQQEQQGPAPTPAAAAAPTNRKSKKRRGNHRKSHSSSAAMSGATFGGDGTTNKMSNHHTSNNGMVSNNNKNYSPRGQAASNHASLNFSPRGEIMSLTSSLRNQSPQQWSPLRGSDSSPSPHQQHNTIQDFNLQLPTPSSSSMQSYHHSYRGPPLLSLSSTQRGEAVYLARQQLAKKESTHKKNLRLQSAQLLVENVKGVEQPAACRNVFWLLLFVFHLLFVGYVGNEYGIDALTSSTAITASTAEMADYHHPYRNSQKDQDNNTSTTQVHDGYYKSFLHYDMALSTTSEDEVIIKIDYKNFVLMASFSGAVAIAGSILLLGAMTYFARHFVQITLFMAITMSFAWGTIGIGLSPTTIVPITGVVALALSVAYAFIVWDRLPFATANLVTALSGIRAFPSTLVIAVSFQLVALAWSTYFAIVVCGVYDAIEEGKIQLSQRMAIFVYSLLGISYYWTFHVLLNCVLTITSRVIGDWWHDPTTENLVRHAVAKTLFYSTGSICYGSLFVGPVRFLRQMSVLVRPSTREETSLLSLHECVHFFQRCLSSFVDGLVRRVNAWAFTYTGMYGYGFVEAGTKATELFEKRGWNKIVSDDLVPNVLLMTSLVVGGLTGCFACFVGQIDQVHITSLNAPLMIHFLEGLLVGLVVTSILFGVISGAVNTVLVCFASSPMEFQQNHPALSDDMRAAWREVWPGALDVVDMRVVNTGNAAGAPLPPLTTGVPTEEQPLLM